MLPINEFAIRTIPGWLKAALTVLVGVTFAASVGIAVVGVRSLDRTAFVQAAASLIAICLPILVVGSVVVFSSAGTAALSVRTRRVLHDVVPDALRRLPLDHTFGEVAVRDSIERSGFSALYELSLTTGSEHELAVLMRLELNVRKANVSYFLFAVPASSQTEGSERAGIRSMIEMFPSNIKGAIAEGYLVPGTVLPTTDGSGRSEFMLSRSLSERFLWDTADQLYFAQDLSMMTAGFIRENPVPFALPREVPDSSW